MQMCERVMLLRLQKQPSLKLVIGTAIAFFLFTTLSTLHRHYTFYSSYDQGLFNQVFWNSIHGRLFEGSLTSQLSTNVVHGGDVPEVFYRHLGQHFNPVFLLWLPFYALFPSPATLNILQNLLVTAAGLVLYALARHHLEPLLSATIAVSFYCANATLGPILANFHDVSPTPLFVFMLLLAMEKRWWWLFSVSAVLILGVREDSGVALFSIGFYLILSKRYPQIGLGLCSLSLVYMILLTNAIMPLFSQDVSQRLMMERFGQYANSKQATPIEILWAMVKNPLRLLEQILSPFFKKFKYLLGQWLPLAFVPAVSPEAWLLAGFPLLYIFLQRGESPLAINIRYAMPVVPGLFYGAILWWAKRQEKFKKSSVRRFWIFCLSLSLIFSIASSPNKTFSFIFPESYIPWVHVPLTQQWHHAAQMRQLLDGIPPDASVAATTYVVPHVSSRREVIRFPALQLRNDDRQVVNVDYVIADLLMPYKYQVAFKRDVQNLQEMIAVIDEATGEKRDRQYGIIGFKDAIVAMQKGAASKPEAMAAWLAFRQQVLSKRSISNPICRKI